MKRLLNDPSPWKKRPDVVRSETINDRGMRNIIYFPATTKNEKLRSRNHAERRLCPLKHPAALLKPSKFELCKIWVRMCAATMS